MKRLDIGEVSARSGVKPSALRFYEEAGLIAPIARHGLRRQYPSEVLLRLSLIAMGRSAGFTLAEIAGMFGRSDAPDLPRDELHRKADALDRRIHELSALRDTLRHVADCPAASHMECPTFRRLVRVAGRRRARLGAARASQPGLG